MRILSFEYGIFSSSVWFTSVLRAGGHCTVKSRTVLIKVKTRPSAAAQRCLALRSTCAASVHSAPWVDYFFPSAYVQVRPRQTCAWQQLRTNKGTGVCRDAAMVRYWADTMPIFKTRNWTVAFLFLVDAFLLLFNSTEKRRNHCKNKKPQT